MGRNRAMRTDILRSRRASSARASWKPLGCVLSLASCWGCSSDLGDCHEQAAREIVYSSSGMVATKGQALLHDSCGQGVLCHASAAKGAARKGASKDLNFDMLPNP